MSKVKFTVKFTSAIKGLLSLKHFIQSESPVSIKARLAGSFIG